MYSPFFESYNPNPGDIQFQGNYDSQSNIEYWDEKVKRGIFDEEFLYPNPLNNEPWGTNYKLYKEVHKNRIRTLASYTDAKNIFDVIRNNQVILITMGTGAGKTVMMPKIMLHYFAYQKKIAITIPRKSITETAGIYGADTLDCELGKEVGYRHGSERTKSSEETMLLYTTDGTIKGKMTSTDPDLSEYYSIIIDEAHERNVNIDILFSLLKNLCKKRPEFKLVIMSATVDTNVFKNYFEKNGLTFKHYHVATSDETPKYSIDKIFLEYPISKKDSPVYMEKYIDHILKNTNDGDIIAFVNTMSPAIKIIEALEKNRKKYNGNPCFIAYSSSAPSEEQKLAKDKDETTNKPYYMTKGYTRCVIIGTPALESSFTAPGQMVYVIDSGLAKDVWYDPNKFAYVSDTVYVTRSSIIQRQGRTGRICSGQAYMMYTKELFDGLKEYNDPTILRSDITNDILVIMSLPTTKNLPKTLEFMEDMLTPPTVESIEAGLKLLFNYSIINSKGDLTEVGKAITTLGKLGPEISRMLIVSYYFNCMDDIILLATMLISTQNKDLSEYIKPPGMNSTSEDRDLYRRKMDKFKHPMGDHFVLINILKSYLMVHELDREQWCKNLGFRYDFFKKNIEQDYESIKRSLEALEFPQMFTHFPPPSKPETPPTDIVQYLKLYNKKLMDSMYGPNLQQTRFTYKYGGGKIKKEKEIISDIKIDIENKHDKLIKEFLESKKIKIVGKEINGEEVEDESQLSSRIEDTITITFGHDQDSSRTEHLINFDFDMSLKKSDRENLYGKHKYEYEKYKINKLLNIVNKKYKGKHLNDLDIDDDLKKILLMNNKKYNDYQLVISEESKNKQNKKNNQNKKQILEENIIDFKTEGEGEGEGESEYEDEDTFEDLYEEYFIKEMNPIRKTEKDLLIDYDNNKKIMESLAGLKLINPSAFVDLKNKTKPKTIKHPRKYKDRKVHIQNKKTKYKNRKINIIKMKGGDNNININNSKKIDTILEKERHKFGAFLDQLSLRTDSSILPILRIFESHEENIMACIYYGFYMRIAVNFYQNKYLNKLSRIDSTFQNSYIDYNKKNVDPPSMIIYQNLSINNGKANMGIVSKLSPRIINAFI
jgi:HrpA-like RNA helicase